MKTLDDKFIRLMNADIDGTASESERTDLREYLSSLPEARAMYDDLAGLANVLSRVEALEPPAELRREIMAALPVRRPGTRVHERYNVGYFWLPVLKYGYALAAGILLGLVLARVPFRNLTLSNPSDLYGTMTAKGPAQQIAAKDQMNLDLADLKGSATLSRISSGVRIGFDLNASRPTQVIVGLGDGQYFFQGFDQETDSAREFEAGEGRITFLFDGENRSTLLLSARNRAAVSINLEFLVSGRMVRSGTLRLPENR